MYIFWPCATAVPKPMSTHPLGRSLGEPLRAVVKACTSLVEAAPGCDVADRQVAGAAVHMVLAAGGLRKWAASPGEAVTKVLTHAAACAACNATSVSPMVMMKVVH